MTGMMAVKLKISWSLFIVMIWGYLKDPRPWEYDIRIFNNNYYYNVQLISENKSLTELTNSKDTNFQNFF